MLETPVLFLIFNRASTSAIVFEQIRIAKPKQLFIAADGPRPGNEKDIIKCEETRNTILNAIDWDCEVKTLFRKDNLGCGRAVSGSITWFFEQVEQGIILEDDCLPSQDFFKFCELMLNTHKDNLNVYHVSGCNQNDKIYGNSLYYFSKYANIWGWATWKRAWQNYRYQVDQIFEDPIDLKRTFKDPFERKFWLSVYNVLINYGLDTWDYQWILSIIRVKGLCVNTNYNLISNIGFNDEATHTTYDGPQANREIKTIPWSTNFGKVEQKIIEAADIDLMRNIHGIKNRGYLDLVLRKFVNLLHKMKLIKKSPAYFKNK